MLTFEGVVRSRQSYREFHPTAVPDALLREVLQDAQSAPSNCSTQPWNVHVVSGARRDAVSKALVLANVEGHLSPDYFWDDAAFFDRDEDRRREHGKLYYGGLGIERQDKEGRARVSTSNFTFFGAPHVAFLFMPAI